ncbi:hypothetical protein [Nonomuraea sp. NPDC048826]|uniref:hypothetical protein n=1 Tax=Nonomuraea sp. NPDC048826 TaxID=3364347 RepID=UPI003712126E
MMIRFLAVLALVTGFLVLGGGTAYACKCVPLEPAERVREADAVFTATATRVRVDEPMLNGGRVTATLRADRVFKGRERAEFEVVTRAEGAACGYTFEKGRRYLVFAREGDDGLSTSLCSGNEVLARGAGALVTADGQEIPEPLVAADTGEAPKPLAAPGASLKAEPGAAESAGFPVALAVLTAVAAAVALVTVLTWAFVRRRPR